MLFCRHTCMSSHSRRAHCCILAVYMQLPGPAITSPPPPQTHLHHLAAPQLCAHFTYAPSAGPLVCSHSRWARRCIPTAVCMQLRGPTRTINPPPPLPSQRDRSHASIQVIHRPRVLSYVHIVSGPAAELSQRFACSSAGPLVRFTPPPPTPTISAGPQPFFHLGHSPSAGPLVCSYSRRARRCIPTAVCMQLRGPARTFNPPTPTIPAGPQLCFHFGHVPSAGPLVCS